MTDDPNPFELDLDGMYERYLVTCRMSGVEPVPRERALGLVQEWTEVLSGRPNRRRTRGVRTTWTSPSLAGREPRTSAGSARAGITECDSAGAYLRHGDPFFKEAVLLPGSTRDHPGATRDARLFRGHS